VKNILVAPLDWGLGHATRCIPIIRKLLNRDANVIIAGSGRSFELLKKEFPNLTFVLLPGYNITYPRTGFIAGMMLGQMPKLLLRVFLEHQRLKAIVQNYDVHAVISDNRFGLWHRTVPTVYMTHQVLIRMPGMLRHLEPVISAIHRFVMRKYSECWIPDNEGELNLSGDLAHKCKPPENSHYIGPLSRFQTIKKEKKWDVIAIVSGPEPQRTIFENLVLKQAAQLQVKTLVISGVTEDNGDKNQNGNLTVVPYMTAEELNEAIAQSDIVLMRSGYSGIMDIAKLGKKAILVPTPGQTEQMYLAQRFHRKKIFLYQYQGKLDLKSALREIENYSGVNEQHFSGDLLEERIDKLLAD